MADYVELLDAEGKKRKISADEIESQFVQRLKMQFGSDGSATDVSSGNPLPVADSAAAAKLAELVTLLGGTIKVGDGSGLLTVEVGAALPAGGNNIGDVDVVGGTVAHDSADGGNPVKVGARARTELAAAVSQNDRADLMADPFGRLLTAPIPLDQRVSNTLNRTDATAGQLLAALGSGAYVITAITVTNAGAVSTKVEILDEAQAKWKGHAVKEGGGFTVADPNGLFVTTKNQAVKGKCATPGADVDINISGYKIPA